MIAWSHVISYTKCTAQIKIFSKTWYTDVVMARLEETQSWKSFFFSKLFLVGAFLFAVMLSLSYAQSFYQDYEAQAQIAHLQEEAARLESKKIELLEQLHYVQSDSFAEAKGKMDLNLLKSGEKMALVPTFSGKNKDRQGDSAVIESNHYVNLSKWWHLFFAPDAT